MTLEIPRTRDFVVFTTHDFARHSGASTASASRRLGAAAEAGVLTRITRGLWANVEHPDFHPLICVEGIVGNEHGYASFLTALHLHGVISQIPPTFHLATTGRSRIVTTPVGRFELIQLSPALHRDGIEWSDTKRPYLIATAEKAMLDTLYLSTRRKRRFRHLPELELDDFSRPRFRRLVREMTNRRLAEAVRRRAEELGIWG